MANGENGTGGLAGKIKRLRQRVQRREKQTRAKRRAKSRRIEKEEPKNVSEKAQVKAKQAKEQVEATKEETAQLAEDARTLIATETGVSKSEAGGVISQAADILESADTDQLDLDGDGDTDLLNVVEQPMERETDLPGLEPVAGEVDFFTSEQSQAQRGRERAIEEGRPTNLERDMLEDTGDSLVEF